MEGSNRFGRQFPISLGTPDLQRGRFWAVLKQEYGSFLNNSQQADCQELHL